jgi:predicted permease
MDTFRDIRYSIRHLLKNPGFTIVAVLVLALGIGANAAVFSLVNTLLIRPLPGQRAGELVGCYTRNKKTGGYHQFSYPNYLDLRERNKVFAHLMAHNLQTVGLNEGEITRRVGADFITANYFSTFGAQISRGRAFLPAEEQPGSGIPVAVVTHQYWKRNGADPDLVGKSLRINGLSYTVVGIASEGFTGTTALFSPDIWLPLGMYDTVVNAFSKESQRHLNDRSNHTLILAGQLKPGVPRAVAEPELAGLAEQLEKAFPAENKDRTFALNDLPRLSIGSGPETGSTLTTIAALLMGMASVVLLIACLNLANMLLARGTARRKEFAIRLSLGARRGRILRQLLTEGLVLSILGGAAGLVLAYWATDLLVASLVRVLPFLTIVFEGGPDFRVLSATLGFCVLSTVLSGLGPALKVSRPDVVSDLKEQVGESTVGGRKPGFFGTRNLLIISQIALSLALLTAGGLFIRGALKAAQLDPGFTLDNGIVVEVDPKLAGYDEVRGHEVVRVLAERLGALPGIEAVSVAQLVPFGGAENSRNVMKAGSAIPFDDSSPAAGEKPVSARSNRIGADYFRIMRIPLLRGREFNRAEAELGRPPLVAIVDQALANRIFPGEDPLGKRIEFAGRRPGQAPKEMEIVGIVAGLRDRISDHVLQPHVWLPFAQDYPSTANFHLRVAARGDAAEAAMLRAIRQEIRSYDDRLPVLALRTLRRHFQEGPDQWLVRTGAAVFSVLGALALILALVGVYGVKAYAVARRTREIGIRLAVGATARDVLWLVLREGIAMTLTGVGIGLLLAAAAARLLYSILYGVSATDPVIFSAAPLLLAAASLLACYIPARRATKVDPMVALRYE